MTAANRVLSAGSLTANTAPYAWQRWNAQRMRNRSALSRSGKSMYDPSRSTVSGSKSTDDPLKSAPTVQSSVISGAAPKPANASYSASTAASQSVRSSRSTRPVELQPILFSTVSALLSRGPVRCSTDNIMAVCSFVSSVDTLRLQLLA
eukprot:CAMPEP_0198727048 /NCGR_PEP_ID=MMETSP1475-20131203/3898_1 /TAXON_ID= ORGANISM="Unidentified sp., Strain CCMP1999" /NCGR_SAMPLE_ID=MMETSP1475 /ASSEMBLY_ACC=CAM_ASM_001111 /LENGTH=148 /DNA_ID=CAMNT_0044489035 /DNA_START=659 /DNA_END=1105 /DNA_ORIENTATION=-